MNLKIQSPYIHEVRVTTGNFHDCLHKFEDSMTKKKQEAPSEQTEELSAESLKSKLDNLGSELESETQKQIDGLVKQLEEAKELAAQNWEKLLRKEAELQNIKKRADNDVSNARKFGIERFAQELLAVIDSFEIAQGVDANDSSAVAIKEGMDLTHKALIDVLEKFGIKAVDPIGEAFNPQFHEAISMQESSDVAPNQVLMVMQKGFMVHERVLRPARVIVAKAVTVEAGEQK